MSERVPLKTLQEEMSDKEFRTSFAADQCMVNISVAIRNTREQRGLSQEDLALMTGKSQSVISRLEDPDYGRMSVQTLLCIAKALDLPLRIVFGEWEDFGFAPPASQSDAGSGPNANTGGEL